MAKGHAKRPPSQRQLKVGEELRHAISEIVMRGELYVPGTAKSLKVTISEVRVSPDLRNATVYVMPLGGENQEETLDVLNELAPQVRHGVSQKVHLRHMPAFIFRLDSSFDNASHVDALLRKPEVQRDLTTDSTQIDATA